VPGTGPEAACAVEFWSLKIYSISNATLTLSVCPLKLSLMFSLAFRPVARVRGTAPCATVPVSLSIRVLFLINKLLHRIRIYDVTKNLLRKKEDVYTIFKKLNPIKLALGK
jgi:hypothetical protein